jgi:5-(carboxyamino)imidazole ribonucleotide synthase
MMSLLRLLDLSLLMCARMTTPTSAPMFDGDVSRGGDNCYLELKKSKPSLESLMRLGILGGGQLGRMLGLAAIPLGVRCRFLDPNEDAPAAAVGEHCRGEFEDTEALGRFADGLDAVTYEFENVPVAAAEWLAARLPVYPPARALAASQERLAEKSFFKGLGIATPAFAPADNLQQLGAAIGEIGLPAVVKTRRFGYDGKGQAIVRATLDIEGVWRQLGGKPLIVESLVRFDRELSIIAVRSRDGEVRTYPLVQNTHGDGILRLSIAPAPNLTPSLQRAADEIIRHAMTALDYVGVLAIELFDVGGSLLVNEMAPRVHNSGHWTIEGAETSQFENHVRAVMGLPLGETAMRGFAAMVNMIGELPDTRAILAEPGTHLHLYGKEPRPKRKIGHITVRADDRDTLNQRLASIGRLIPDHR